MYLDVLSNFMQLFIKMIIGPNSYEFDTKLQTWTLTQKCFVFPLVMYAMLCLPFAVLRLDERICLGTALQLR